MKEGKVAWKEFMINETLSNLYFFKKIGTDHNNKPVEWVNLFIPCKKDKNN